MADAMWAINQAWVLSLAALALIGVVTILGTSWMWKLRSEFQAVRDDHRIRSALVDSGMARFQGRIETIDRQMVALTKQAEIEDRIGKLELREVGRGAVVVRPKP